MLDAWRVESCGDDPWDEGGGEFAGLLGGEQQRDSGVNVKGWDNGEGYWYSRTSGGNASFIRTNSITRLSS